MVALDVLLHHAAATDSGADDGAGGDKGFVVVAVQFFDELAHSRGFDVETADGVTGFQLLADVLVFFEGGYVVYVDVDMLVAFGEFYAFFDMPESALAEDV